MTLLKRMEVVFPESAGLRALTNIESKKIGWMDLMPRTKLGGPGLAVDSPYAHDTHQRGYMALPDSKDTVV